LLLGSNSMAESFVLCRVESPLQPFSASTRPEKE
jgi:hypothetical protein